MGRKDQEASSTSGTPQRTDAGGQSYQPPQVAWEEEFAPLADSLCTPGSGNICPDGTRPSGDGS